VRCLQRVALAEQFYESSALADLLSVPAEKVNEDRFYRALDALLPHKPALEKHLKDKLGELFELDSRKPCLARWISRRPSPLI
jgi:hypothetical protein